MNEQNMISFAPLQKRHFAYLAEWMQEPHLWKWWGEGRQWSLQDIERKYASYVDGYKLESGEKKPIHAFLIEYAGKPIGYIQYYSAFDFPREGYKVQDIWQGNSLAALDFFIGDAAYLGKGVGVIALRLFLEKHVYSEFSVCLVDPDKENQAAINTYERAGFKPYGELKRSILMVAQPIYLAPYSSEWPQEFEKEKKLLLKAIGQWVEDIQHVGSTAVPCLAAKPVIDIMVGVRRLKEADEHCVSAIEQLGYDYIKKYEETVPERRYFQKQTAEGVRTHQIHLVEIDSDWWQRHLLFRDYLRSHPEVAKDYENLKRALAKAHTDTNEYAKAKTAFIREIEKRVKKRHNERKK